MTKIAWTDVTWNPTAGCTRVGIDCEGCYAEREAHRLASNPKLGGIYTGLTWKTSRGPTWTGKLRLLPERLPLPLRSRQARMCFVDSMSDLFHPAVPDDFIGAVYAVMGLRMDWRFQVLTKRPERRRDWLRAWSYEQCIDALFRVYPNMPSPPGLGRRVGANLRAQGLEAWLDPEIETWPLPNVWELTSVGNEATCCERIDATLATYWIGRDRRVGGAVGLSCEPLLGPIDLSGPIPRVPPEWRHRLHEYKDCQSALTWVIVGVESRGAFVGRLGEFRSETDWIDGAVALVEQCRAGGVAPFVKQVPIGGRVVKDLDLFPEPLRIREYPTP